MITSTTHFTHQKEKIYRVLMTTGHQPRTSYFYSDNYYPYTQEELQDWYLRNFATFPLHTQRSGEAVSIGNRFQHTYRKYHKLEQVQPPHTDRVKDLEDMDRDGILLDLEEYIHEWIDNIFIDFKQAIDLAKKEPAFACVNDDVLVMKNLLGYYTHIRASTDTQPFFFDFTYIPKAVADEMTDILITLLKDRIQMIETAFQFDAVSVRPAPAADDPYQISWFGLSTGIRRIDPSVNR